MGRSKYFSYLPHHSEFDIGTTLTQQTRDIDPMMIYCWPIVFVRRRTNDVSMLAHRLRRRTNIKTALVQRLVFAGKSGLGI